MSGATPQEEYEAALAQYQAAQVRLIEAKRHFNPKAAPAAIEQRRAKQAEYRAMRRAARNTPEAKAARERFKQEARNWLQSIRSIGGQ